MLAKLAQATNMTKYLTNIFPIFIKILMKFSKFSLLKIVKWIKYPHISSRKLYFKFSLIIMLYSYKMEKKNHDKTPKATNKDKPKTKSKPKIFKYLTIFLIK